MGQGMDGMNESWEPEEIDEPQRRRVNTILPETEQLRVEADGLYKRAKKAEEKNKTLTAERDQLRAEVEDIRQQRDYWQEEAVEMRRYKEASESLVAALREALDDAGDVVHACVCETEEIRGKVCHLSCIAINAALSLTPASAGARLKAEATRKCAAVLRDDLIAAAGEVQGKEFINAIYAASGWLEQMADGIEAEAREAYKVAANFELRARLSRAEKVLAVAASEKLRVVGTDLEALEKAAGVVE